MAAWPLRTTTDRGLGPTPTGTHASSRAHSLTVQPQSKCDLTPSQYMTLQHLLCPHTLPHPHLVRLEPALALEVLDLAPVLVKACAHIGEFWESASVLPSTFVSLLSVCLLSVSLLSVCLLSVSPSPSLSPPFFPSSRQVPSFSSTSPPLQPALDSPFRFRSTLWN